MGLKKIPDIFSRRKFTEYLEWLKKRSQTRPAYDKRFVTSFTVAALIIVLFVFFVLILAEKEERPLPAKTGHKKAVELRAAPPKKKARTGIRIFSTAPKVAIILDDAGGNLPDYSAIYSIKQPITISVIPYLPLSRKIAREASYKGVEVMLHLPMEPENGKYVTDANRKTMILDSMTDKEITDKVNGGIESVKWMVGINNHMGSRATQDKRVMSDVMRAIKGRTIYFVDSGTSSRSISGSMAQEYKVLFAQNNIFLDGDADKSSIEARFQMLIRMAKENGRAIGIGHATRKQTIDVLKELMPKYAKAGIDFVYVSEMVK